MYFDRRVSVMRGQVLSPQGLGIVGIRVSVDRDSRFGFTLTRAGGWFDVLVNGGGAVTLQFQRSPFQPLTRTLFVPWNQIVVLPPITMQLGDDADNFRGSGAHPALALGAPSLMTALHTARPCMDHDNTVLVPVVLSTWMPEKVGGLAGKSLVLAETQMLQESIRIPGSGLHLMYRSSLASGYLSRVVMRLTHSAIPPSLVRVHVRVEIEGSVHTKTYEADPNLTHTFAWNKRNVYKQKAHTYAFFPPPPGGPSPSLLLDCLETLSPFLPRAETDGPLSEGPFFKKREQVGLSSSTAALACGVDLLEGSVHTKTYEADPNLTHTFAWNKRNVYKQKVYGVAQAKISVGYEHATCPNIVWETQTAMLQGFDVDISDVGGWSLDIHHHYNFHEGILQKGDGSTLHLKQFPRTVRVVMGTGLQRPLVCKDCDGPAKDARLLTPVALTSGPDGSLYVGDFNLVRRLTPQGSVYTVLQLSATQVSYQYYLSLSPADGRLYISDPERHQILRVLNLDSVSDPTINWEPAVGSGERCIPGDETSCGDEGPAISAKLAHPKGLAMAADKTMYFADGTNIRSVDPDGIIHTLIGHHRHLNVWQPIPCQGAIPAQQAQLQWPTGLSLSPLDGSLHFIDDRLVLKLTADMKVKVVAGTPLHCHTHKEDKKQPAVRLENHHKNQNSDDDSSTTLGQVLALAFSPSGQLFIADSDSRKVNAIRVVDPAGRMADFAGRGHFFDKRDCDCMANNSSGTIPCQCWTESSVNSRETLMSTTARFTSISAIAVSPDGVVNIADQGNLHILALEHYLATHDENGEFRIPYTPTGEEYIFNRYGQHIATRDITTGKSRYTFLYSKNTSFGKLSTVTDSAGNKILFLRDYSNVVSAIENTQDHKCELNISGVGFLTKFSEKGRSEVVLDYDSNTGLLTSRADLMAGGGSTFLYQYDSLGRVSHVVLPTGESINLASRLTADDELEVQISSPVQASVNMDSSVHVTTIKMEGHSHKRMTIRDGLSGLSEAVSYRNGTFLLRQHSGSWTLVAAEATHPLLELSLPVEAEMFPLWSRQTTARGPIVNNMAWSYALVGDAGTSQQTIHRQLWVNNSKVLGVMYEQMAGRETILDCEKESLLKVSFDAAGLPLSWQPGGSPLPVNITYDRFNRLESWTWGVQSEHYSYDRHGLLEEIKTKQDGSVIFSYNDGNMLSHITLASGRKFTMLYDDLGGLRHVTLPSGTRHSFSAQPSIGFLRYTYTPPGSTRAYLQHYTHSGRLLQTVYPGDGARVLYRYHNSEQLAEVVHGDGVTQIKHVPNTKLPSQILHSEKDFEYRWDYQYSGGLLMEERLDYSPKTGLSNAKFTYQYDDNFRVVSVQGRIGGQSLLDHVLKYSPRTGAKQQLGQFTVSWPQPNETSLFDGTAVFNRITNAYFQIAEISVTIHRMEVFRMEFAYDSRNRISQTRTYTRNVGVNMYTNIKNLTWDADGQLAAVEAQEPWGFKYDDNGNMLSLTYRGNTIPMEYNVMDRIVKFGEGLYRYDNRGLVVQNAREEKFHYNAKGLLTRATKRGRFDVRYYYDHLDRLATRKDNYGNVTQFFYTNHQRPNEVSQIYSPRDSKLMTLVYDDRGHLIFAQVYRHKYYIATDQCGTPIMVFNQYGEGIREIMRSPYGHIVYDSNPYLYLPVDFCGGLLDQVTSLVHMSGGKVYDPLIGQWMSPMWNDILNRVTNPRLLHLYRFNGNDPINVGHSPKHLADEEHWLSRLGYDLSSMAPQLSQKLVSPMTNKFRVESGFFSQLSQKTMSRGLSSLSLPEARMRLDPLNPSVFGTTVEEDSINGLSLEHTQNWVLQPGSSSEPPFGRGILVSRQAGNRAVIYSVPTANSIYRDVITSVFNNTFLLPFTLVAHGVLQDAFHFVKEDAWRAQEDRAQLKRFGSQFNTTFHEKEGEAGSGKVLDVRIHRPNAVINLRYGTTLTRERQRLLHHCKTAALRKAWHRERDALRNNVPAAWDWTQQEADEILKLGAASGYEGEYIRDVERYPELAEDPYNIKFVKKAQNRR
ncbi:hypothetical protein J6590_024932 [Homalodisca vitripennis]|nr:hypothetical protein J6590_024932 [Homalodisca vitripennis]